jgi:NAD(P)-dependent dehydrogenase (short-subunit alcohol dehydrogenase family)
MLLEGKVVLITGAARGIGRAAALVLAEEGATVGVADIAPDVEATAQAIVHLGRRSACAVFDIADPAAVHAGVERIRAQLGPIDVLVNDAAIVTNIAPLSRMTHDAWNREVAVNLSGAFNMIKAVIDSMLERRWGRIINVSSVAATGGLHNQAGYAATKAGLLGLTQTVTLEYARHGITCNAILPGLIATELAQQMPAEIRERAVAITPARRLGQMREVGQLIAFLASDGAGFINGATIHIDGGLRLNTVPLGSRRESAEVVSSSPSPSGSEQG